MSSCGVLSRYCANVVSLPCIFNYMMLMSLLTIAVWYFTQESQVDREEVEATSLEAYGSMVGIRRSGFLYISMQTLKSLINWPQQEISFFAHPMYPVNHMFLMDHSHQPCSPIPTSMKFHCIIIIMMVGIKLLQITQILRIKVGVNWLKVLITIGLMILLKFRQIHPTQMTSNISNLPLIPTQRPLTLMFLMLSLPQTMLSWKIDLEHPDLDRESVGNDVKGKEAIIHA